MNEQILLKKNFVKYTELIEITVPAASTLVRFQFPDLQNLRNTKLKGLQIFTDSEVQQSILTGNPVIVPSVIGSCFITLMTYDGREVIKQLPVVNLTTNNGFGVANISNLGFAQFANLKINWPKSFIEFTKSPADPVEDIAVLFCAYYEQMTQQEMKQQNTFQHKD